MNFLAHAYLSLGDPDLLMGNMISDFIKGKKQFDYSPAVQQGIRLHRAIDQFTDAHESTHHIMAFFRPHYRLYAGPFTDIVLDYFLANDQHEFASAQQLEDFTRTAYAQLETRQQEMPEPFRQMFPYMVSQNWLYNYRNEAGIQKSFAGLVRRAAYLYESEIAFDIFLAHKEEIRVHYNTFFGSVKKYVQALTGRS